MKKELFSAVLAAAIAAGATMAPACANDMSKDRAMKPDKVGKMDHTTKIKSSHLKKRKQNEPAVKNNAIQEDDYTAARERQMKISM
jgi:hypothetical protein